VTRDSPEWKRMTAEVYLGDGLYASFDGWQVRLRAPRQYSDHMVFLEPDVLVSLEKYVADLRRQIAEWNKNAEKSERPQNSEMRK
jgi:hypothetical protein